MPGLVKAKLRTSPERHTHAHTHGVINPELFSTDRGLFAVKWSLVGLAAIALIQIAIYGISGSVALLADTIHNFGGAAQDDTMP